MPKMSIPCTRSGHDHCMDPQTQCLSLSRTLARTPFIFSLSSVPTQKRGHDGAAYLQVSLSTQALCPVAREMFVLPFLPDYSYQVKGRWMPLRNNSGAVTVDAWCAVAGSFLLGPRILNKATLDFKNGSHPEIKQHIVTFSHSIYYQTPVHPSLTSPDDVN